MYVCIAENRQKPWFISEKRISMKIHIPEHANYIVRKLMENGYEAYVVGGCVRDSVLGREPGDWDITTSASPGQVKGLFRRTVDTGIQHGTVTVLIEKDAYEVTTYRVDGKYEDHRRPDSVTFTQCLEEDLLRRDFTMNAMAYNDVDGLVDLYDGLGDLQRGIIRCVGRAEQRFDEDALRILRAYRFAAQLGFSIEEETEKAAKQQSRFLRDISAERIQGELTRLLTGAHPEMLLKAAEAGVTGIVLPEFDAMLSVEQKNPHHQYTVGIHTMEAVKHVAADPVLRWTMLLHDIGKPQCKTTDKEGIDHFKGHAGVGRELAGQILHRLKFDNDTIKTVRRLVQWHDYRWEGADRRIVRRAAAKIGVDVFPMLLEVQRADVLAQSNYHQQDKLEMLEQISGLYQEVMQAQECLSLKDLKINGNQLMELGAPRSPMIGEILRQLLAQVIEHPELNEYEQLKTIVQNDILPLFFNSEGSF